PAPVVETIVARHWAIHVPARVSRTIHISRGVLRTIHIPCITAWIWHVAVHGTVIYVPVDGAIVHAPVHSAIIHVAIFRSTGRDHVTAVEFPRPRRRRNCRTSMVHGREQFTVAARAMFMIDLHSGGFNVAL